jgi:hypothetical protein
MVIRAGTQDVLLSALVGIHQILVVGRAPDVFDEFGEVDAAIVDL